MTKDELVDKALEIVSEHRWDDTDNDLFIELGTFLEEAYEEITKQGRKEVKQ